MFYKSVLRSHLDYEVVIWLSMINSIIHRLCKETNLSNTTQHQHFQVQQSKVAQVKKSIKNQDWKLGNVSLVQETLFIIQNYEKVPNIFDKNDSKKTFKLHHENTCKYPNVENKERIFQKLFLSIFHFKIFAMLSFQLYLNLSSEIYSPSF